MITRRAFQRGALAVSTGLFAASLATGVGAAPNAQSILEASDAVRNPAQPFRVTINITDYEKGAQVDASALLTYSRTLQERGQFASLIQFQQPARDAGKLMLKNGNDLWFYDPGTKASVRISPQQRLMGGASNGDVITVNFARDYKATLVGEETVTDGEKKQRQAYKLALAASGEESTYAAIELWVDTSNNWPIKARMLADSGRLLKTAYYRRFQTQLGAQRPTELVIIDGLNPQSVTLMRLSDFAAKNIPASWFQRDYLARFQPE